MGITRQIGHRGHQPQACMAFSFEEPRAEAGVLHFPNGGGRSKPIVRKAIQQCPSVLETTVQYPNSHCFVNTVTPIEPKPIGVVLGIGHWVLV